MHVTQINTMAFGLYDVGEPLSSDVTWSPGNSIRSVSLQPKGSKLRMTQCARLNSCT